MTREQRTAEVIAKTFDSKMTELKQRIEFQKEQLVSEKRWLKNEEEKGTNQNYIQIGLDSIIAKETEVEMLEAMLETVEKLRAREARKQDRVQFEAMLNAYAEQKEVK